jgi:hypothetical protein
VGLRLSHSHWPLLPLTFRFLHHRIEISQSDPRRRHKKSYRCLDRTYRFGRPPPMERGRSISSVIMMASLGSALSELRRRVESRFSKHRITFRKRMPSVNVFSEVCDASVSITCSSCMRSNSSGYSTLMYATSTEPGHIRGSSSRFPRDLLDRRQKITHVARSSHSRSWVVYTMTTAEAREFFR